MSQEKVISLFIKEAFRLIFLVDEGWILWTNFVFDCEGINLWVPIAVRLRNSPKDYIYAAVHCNKHFDDSILLI